MSIWCAVRGRAPSSGFLLEPRVLPPVVIKVFRTRSEEMGWWRDAVKLSTDRGMLVVIYTPLNSFIGLISRVCSIHV